MSTHRVVADGASVVADQEAFVISHLPVRFQLGLPRDLHTTQNIVKLLYNTPIQRDLFNNNILHSSYTLQNIVVNHSSEIKNGKKKL